MDRRALLQRLAAAAGAAAWSGETLAVELARAAVDRPAPTSGQAKALRLSTAQRATLAALAELIIPATETPGAKAAGVPAFIEDMAVHWMHEQERVAFYAGLDRVQAAARSTHRKAFAQCNAAQQRALLDVEREAAQSARQPGVSLAARISDPAAPFFYKLRDLTTLGYFTSEVGLTQELAYRPAPGRFDGDVDIATWGRQIVI